MSYAKYIKENILKPLKMNSSFANYNRLTKHNNKAVGYTNKDDKGEFITGLRKENTDLLWKFAIPSGGIYSSVKDLYTYFKAINKHEIITEKSQLLLHKKQVPDSKFLDQIISYGYGFSISNQGKAYTIGHGGSYLGIGSSFEYYPEHDYYVIVLSNYGSIPSQIVASHIKDLIEPND